MPHDLWVPGPVPMPAAVREALSRQMIYQGEPEFGHLLAHVRELVAHAFATSNEILCFSASGTGGLEAAVVNLFSPGDRGVFVIGGRFGERAADIAETFGVEVIKVEHPWGTAIDPQALRRVLRSRRDVKVVYLTHNETSTGVTNPIQDLISVVREESDAVVFIDAISSVGALPFEADRWHADVVVTASQKAFACPPGLAFISVSPRAWAVIEHSQLPRFYWDFQKMRDSHRKGTSSTTPSISLLFAMEASLQLMASEGYPAIFARHAQAGSLVREMVQALGLELMADLAHASNTVTAIRLPEGVSSATVRGELANRYNTIVGEGVGAYKSSTVRIGHMGYFELDHLGRVVDQLGEVISMRGGV